MGQILLTSQNNGITQISNLFIDEHMTDANEVELKLYLYLLRCISGNLPVSIGSIAERFNYSERDINRALTYWQKAGLLSVEFDGNDRVTSICLKDPAALAGAPTQAAPAEPTQSVRAQDFQMIQNAQTVQDAQPSSFTPAPSSDIKPFYSVDQMNDFKNKEDVKQLLFVAEMHMGKQLAPADLRTLLFIYDALSFPVDLISYLVEYCVNSDHRNMRYIEKVALAWADRGITTVDEAKAMGSSGQYRKEAFAVLRALGISGRTIVNSDMEYVAKWMGDYGFPIEMVLEACNRTIAAISSPSFQYVDSILKKWYDSGVRTLDDASAADEQFQAAKKAEEEKASKPAARTMPRKAAANFSQRNDDFNALANKIIMNQ